MIWIQNTDSKYKLSTVRGNKHEQIDDDIWS